jgi:phosphomannomutase
MTRLRASPPTQFGSEEVRYIDDFAAGFEKFPPSDIIRYTLASGTRIIVRPSGTEPKLKAYIDVRDTTGRGEERLMRARKRAKQLGDEIRALLSGTDT